MISPYKCSECLEILIQNVKSSIQLLFPSFEKIPVKICTRTSPFHHFTIHVVPQERRSIVNPNGENQRGIPKKNLQESPIPRKIRVGAKRKSFRGASGRILRQRSLKFKFGFQISGAG